MRAEFRKIERKLFFLLRLRRFASDDESRWWIAPVLRHDPVPHRHRRRRRALTGGTGSTNQPIVRGGSCTWILMRSTWVYMSLSPRLRSRFFRGIFPPRRWVLLLFCPLFIARYPAFATERLRERACLRAAVNSSFWRRFPLTVGVLLPRFLIERSRKIAGNKRSFLD